MIDLQYIRQFFPTTVANNPNFNKQMLKEYLQLMILEHLSHTDYASKVAFIGGTNLRLIRHIDRFSEDLDFDCHQLSEADFMAMTDDVVVFLQQMGLKIETRDRQNARLTAYRRNLYFPELLFDMGLTGHREERFLIKIEAQDQKVEYQPEVKYINIRSSPQAVSSVRSNLPENSGYSSSKSLQPSRLPPTAILCTRVGHLGAERST